MNTTEKTNENIQTVSITELQAKLAGENRLQFWNVLTDEYFNGEMIPESRRVALDRIGREVKETVLEKDAEIIIYCAGPDCPQSRLAAEKLISLGYENVRVFEGGLEEWKNAGYAIENQTESSAQAAA